MTNLSCRKQNFQEQVTKIIVNMQKGP